MRANVATLSRECEDFTPRMDYVKQQEFLTRSRAWGGGIVVFLLAIAAASFNAGHVPGIGAGGAFGIINLALATSVWYSPDYLHLTVNSEKKARWELKIRWRLIPAALLIGLALASGARDIPVILAAAAWLTAVNLLASAVVPLVYYPAYFWGTDFILVGVLLLSARCDVLLGAAMLAAAAHLSIVVCAGHPFSWATSIFSSALMLIFLAGSSRGVNLSVSLLAVALLLMSAFGTAWLVGRAQRQNDENTSAAMRDLVSFTGYSAERVRHLWRVSNQELAKNWEAAGISENDGERMAGWYRENSELYMFAIDGYNLDYKRIRSNLRVLKFARGSCLDYGAGNGELILELARRGHRASYYDVEGCTMKFARERAQQQGLAIEFLHSKNELAAVAGKQGFDTIFSFDVLEHLPDLAGELDYLSSLLRPGGRLVFDVPAGSTKSHPMHLNHNLDVRAYLAAKGLKEERTLVQRLPFKKEEKYVFRAPD